MVIYRGFESPSFLLVFIVLINYTFEVFPIKRRVYEKLYSFFLNSLRFGGTELSVTFSNKYSYNFTIFNCLILARFGLTVFPHMSYCFPLVELFRILKIFRNNKINCVLLIKGDGNLVRTNIILYVIIYVKQVFNVIVSVSAYVECYRNSFNYSLCLNFLNKKIQTGASYLVTQISYDMSSFFVFLSDLKFLLDDLKAVKIGILGFKDLNFLKFVIWNCNVFISNCLNRKFESLINKFFDLRIFYNCLICTICTFLVSSFNIQNFHFYTLNNFKSIIFFIYKLRSLI